ncbi:MAG: CCA tRNA nucleotidyltransferase [Candidatus Diapherotrites archaeon]|uniref:CCA-adding enzyme n=1 Tax=Candidatus Iainarchaeum sp. TaxID=3101447 RepID=A0A2D6LQH7_9ARCH|nr:CCA tRNA nucleotidyltransferase [Candidatus Diapherotrites archaeon]|tara:strand:- start:8616 stop:9995 length:1380 start_codon:yes stop_codon:yes gene_type:complete
MNKILNTVIKRITPSKTERIKQEALATEIIKKITKIKGKHIGVELVGSNARNTHLRGDNDLDIFVFFPEKISREEFEKEGLRIGKNVFRGHKWEKAYSEHPYIRGVIKGFDVEIVPAYSIEDTQKLRSAVDRTSFHNKYLQKKLTPELCNEVRLLKQFLKGIKAYGADLKVSSVPGYVTELLIVNYGSFKKTIQAMTKWQEHEIIDIEKQLNKKEALKKFDSSLIIVDPVDSKRNVAAALSVNQYARIVAATRAFLKKPSSKFFFGAKTKTLDSGKAKKLVEKEGLIIVQIGYPAKELSDILWGQIRRLGKKIVSALGEKDFELLRNAAWSDEEKEIILVFDLEANKLEKAQKRTGPWVTSEEHSEQFLKTHKKALSGPRIEKGRWVVEIEREHDQATEYLKEILKKLKKSEKAGIRKALNKKAKVLSDKEVLEKYRKNKEFKAWFSTYLKGKEEFEEY